MRLFENAKNLLLHILIWTQRVNHFLPGFYIIDSYSQFMNDLSNVNKTTFNSFTPNSTKTKEFALDNSTNIHNPKKDAFAKVLKNICHEDLRPNIDSQCFLSINTRLDFSAWTTKEVEDVLAQNKLYSTVRSDYKSLLALKAKLLGLQEKLNTFMHR